MNKSFWLLSAAVLCVGGICAQEAIEAESPAVEMCESTKDATILLTEYLRGKGWTIGDNEDARGIFKVQIGVGSIQAQKGGKSYNDARVAAFDKAVLDAKAKMAKSLEQTIAVAVESRYTEPGKKISDAETAMAEAMMSMPPESIFGKAKLFLNKKLDNLLREEGYDPAADQAKIAKAKEKIESIVSSETYQKNIESSANCAISGAQVYYTIEIVKKPMAEIGVVLIWSPKLATMASSLVTGRSVAGTKTGRKIISQIPTRPTDLISTFGIQQKINEKGEYVLVSYGQSNAVSANSRAARAAYDKAAQQADAQIRQFAGEYVALTEAQAKAEKTLVYDNGDLPDYSNFSSYQQYQATKAKAMKINGISELTRWRAQHPVSKEEVFGVVMTWSPSSAELARTIKAEMEKTGIAGAEGVPYTPSATPRAPIGQPRVQPAEEIALPDNEYIGRGTEGDEDAF